MKPFFKKSYIFKFDFASEQIICYDLLIDGTLKYYKKRIIDMKCESQYLSMTMDNSFPLNNFWQNQDYHLHCLVVNIGNPLTIYCYNYPLLELHYPADTCKPFLTQKIYLLTFTVFYRKGQLKKIEEPLKDDHHYQLLVGKASEFIKLSNLQ
eukprot:NODE_578_length_5822_cov_0.814957.p4 type:complete len:152 gc:universal NODE_578_length_5822_cov_0.814957:873-1328(+)